MSGGTHSYNVSRDDLGESITSNFSPRKEAKFFIREAFMGRMTYQECGEAILMTPDQLRWLIETKCGEPGVLRRIHWKRQLTWEAFKQMFRQASAATRAA